MQETTAATFCATLVDQWARGGVRHAVIAPGSRSTPLALALVDDGRLAVHVVLDERAASFTALGIGRATGVPAVVLCSSGTAGTHFHGAVVEAHEAGVPLLVCTADRPPELQGVGAPQTIDQRGLYGRAVRLNVEPGVPDPAAAASWRPLAARTLAAATGSPPGPVHLNLAFRDPLVGRPGPLPPSLGPSTVALAPSGQLPVGTLAGRRGVIVAGGGIGDVEGVLALAERSGWPLLADHRSGCRTGGSVVHADALLRHDAFADAEAPEVVVSLGAPLASKVLGQWLATHRPQRIVVDRYGRRRDPEHLAGPVVTGDPGAACRAAAGSWTAPPSDAGKRWRRADGMAAAAISEALAAEATLTEPAVARAVVGSLGAGAHLVVASSMPVRDVEWYGGPTPATVHANRGANGIDGTVSTALGVALSTGAPTTVLVGDLAFLHDSTALVRLADRDVDLTVVVVDNDGGGIFSFLPQATELTADRFELLFGTPHRADLAALARAHRLAVTEAHDEAALAAALRRPGGVQVVVVRTDRAANVGVHDRLHAAVAEAI